jgi:mono/diheme cytochrome c family protein
MKKSGFICLLFAMATLGCREEMRNDSRLKPLQEDPFFADRSSSRPLVPDTVPRGAVDNDDFFYRGEVNGKLVRALPVPVTEDQLDRGRDRFNIYCSVCHGPTGEGDGMIVQRGFPQPPSFHEQRLRDAPEGHFFYVISHGYGVMYPYGDRLTPADRWAVIAYIRALQLSRNSTINDVPPEQKARLMGP